MPLRSVSLSGFRAFANTGEIPIGPLTGFVGKNDCGKSAILHGLRIFFDPPKKGLEATDVHALVKAGESVISLSFDPARLLSTQIRLDAKNELDLVADHVVAADGLLRVRMRFGSDGSSHFEILVSDVDDAALFPLALKKHDELLALLDQRGLPAKKAGKETNQEKRSALRNQALAAGVGMREEWVEASAAEKPIRALLPSFIYFADEARYGIDETPVQNQFKTIVDKVVKAQTEAAAIEAAIQTSVQDEFDKVFSRLSRLTPSVSAMVAITSVSWKKAVDSIALSWGDQFGVQLPYEKRGAGIRRLFMVAYFQYISAEAMHDGQGQRYIFAIEEPELHLHPGAQRDLIAAFHELGDLGHSVLFTTHSPVFSSAVAREYLVLVRRSTVAAEALVYPQYDAIAVAHELGIEASDRLVGKNHVILVEGLGDVGFYEYLLAELRAEGMTTLDPAKVLFLQCGGMTNLQFMATAECIAEANLKWAVLMDSDRATPSGPMSAAATTLTTSPPRTCLAVRILDRSFIENYLDPTDVLAETGVSCIVPKFGKATSVAGTPLPPPQWQLIKKNVTAIARRMGRKKLIAAGSRADKSCEWQDHFEAVRVAFGL